MGKRVALKAGRVWFNQGEKMWYHNMNIYTCWDEQESGMKIF